MIRLASRLTGFRRAESGTATVEFAILFPMFIFLMLSGIEAGMLMTRQLMLERGLDITMRSLRLGTLGDTSPENVKAMICQHAIIIPNCAGMLELEMNEVDTVAWNVPLEGDRCVDRTITEISPPTEPPTFNTGARNKLVMVRACAAFDPLFPGAGLGARLPRDKSGKGYMLRATSGFTNEP